MDGQLVVELVTAVLCAAGGFLAGWALCAARRTRTAPAADARGQGGAALSDLFKPPPLVRLPAISLTPDEVAAIKDAFRRQVLRPSVIHVLPAEDLCATHPTVAEMNAATDLTGLVHDDPAFRDWLDRGSES